MRPVGAFVCAVMLVCLGIVPGHADKRVALIIGNGDYQHADKLANPVTDARRMRDTLTKLGFEIVYGENLDQQSLRRTIGRFANAAHESDVALVFFAGHGATFGDVPYVVPVDAQFSSLGEIPYELVQVETLIGELRRAKGLRIAILDACRDNSAERELKRKATRGGDVTRGLGRVKNPEGLILAYATQYLSTAADGDPNGDSPFTTALLHHIATPGLDVTDLFVRVGREVIATTKDQRPEISVSFYDPYTLVPAESGPVVPGPAPISPPQAHTAQASALTKNTSVEPSPLITVDRESKLWEAAKSNDTVSAYRAYLEQFQDGFYAGMAKAAIERLTPKPVMTMAVSTPEPETTASIEAKPRPPHGTTYWDHNGSLIYLEASVATGSRKFYYYTPRSSMLAAGARPGSLLFDGRRSGNRYNGKAYIFAGRCGTFSYDVSGDVLNDETVVMTGSAPHVDPATCSISNYRSDRLELTYKYKD